MSSPLDNPYDEVASSVKDDLKELDSKRNFGVAGKAAPFVAGFLKKRLESLGESSKEGILDILEFVDAVSKTALGAGTISVQQLIPGEQTAERLIKESKSRGGRLDERLRSAFEGQDFPSTNIPISPVSIPLPFGKSLQNVDIGVKGALEFAADPLVFATGGIGAVFKGGRVATQAARAGFKAGPLAKAQVLKEEKLVPPRLLSDLQNFDTQMNVAFDPNKARQIGEQVSRMPGIGPIVTTANPTLKANTPLKKAYVVHSQLKEEGFGKAQQAMSHPGQIGTQSDLFGPTNLKTGLLEKGPLAGKSLNQIAENPSRFVLNEPQKAWLSRMREVEDAIFAGYTRNGIKIHTIPLDDIEHYAGRTVVGKFLPGTDDLVEVGFIGGPGRLGGKTSAEKLRRFSTIERSQAEGYVYMPYEESIKQRALSMYRRVGNKKTSEWILRNLPEGVAARSTATPSGLVKAAKEATKYFESVRKVGLITQRALRGESPPGATLHAIRMQTPELGALLDRALAITPLELDKAFSTLSVELRHELKITTKSFRKMLDQARLAKRRQQPPRGDLPPAADSRVTVVDKVRVGVRDITPGELTQAIKLLGADQRTTIRMLNQIYKNAFKFTNAERADALRLVRMEVEQQLPFARAAKKAAISERAEGRALAQSTRLLEARSTQPAFSGPIFKGPNAEEFVKDLDTFFASEGVPTWLTNVNKLNQIQRMLVLVGDASPFLIQLIATPMRHPITFFKTGAVFAKTLTTAFINPAAARQIKANLYASNRAHIDEMKGLILSGPTGLEGTEALVKGGFMAPGTPLGKVASIYRPFQAAYETSLDYATIHISLGLKHLAAGDPKKLQAIADYSNHMSGIASSGRLGATPFQRAAESALLLAPRYRRAVASLHADALQGGLRGELARDAYASLAVGVIGTFTATTISLGMARGDSPSKIKADLRRGLDPSSKQFLLWRLGGQWIGLGSKFVSDLRFISKVITQPENFLEFGPYKNNPGVQWVRGQLAGVPGTAWTVFTGSNYMGEPVKVTDPRSLARELGNWVVPIWVQGSILDGGDIEGRAIRGAGDFLGMRAHPQRIYALLGGDDALKSYIDSYNEIETTKEARVAAGQRQSRDSYRKSNPEVDARLFLIGKVSTLKTTIAKVIALNLIKERDLLSEDIEPELLAVWEDVLGKRMLESLKSQSGRSSSTSSSESIPSHDLFPTYSTDAEKWEAISRSFTSRDFNALTKVWRGATISSKEMSNLRSVFERYPLGQTDFNVWLKQTLRQVQENAVNQNR
jgi:hypothetical protein